MPDYKYVISDTSSGVNLGEFALTPTSTYSRVMNGVGVFNATMLLDDPNCTPANLKGDRELTIYRDDAAQWNGPLVTSNPLRSSGVIQLGFREASWHFSKRVLEQSKNFNADLYYIARTLFVYALGKRSNGTTSGGTSINAPIPRFFMNPASGTSGTVKSYYWSAASRPTILSLMDQLVEDPTTGLDYKMVYGGGSRQQCTRTITFGSPALGTTRTQKLTEHVLADYGFTADRERAASRVHTVGSGYTDTQQNSGSITAGDTLLEAVFDRTDLANLTAIQNFGRDARRLAQPPVETYQVWFEPGTALPMGWCDLGDTVPLAISSPAILAVTGTRRIVQIDVQPQTASTKERVGLTFNLPLDQLGT